MRRKGPLLLILALAATIQSIPLTSLAAADLTPQLNAIPNTDPKMTRPQDAATSESRWPAIMSTAMRSSNLDRSLHFYVDGLDMVVQGKIVSGPTTEVMLGFKDRSDQAGLILLQSSGPEASMAVEQGNSGFKVVMGVKDALATAERLKSLGFKTSEIQSHGPYKVFNAHDPDGYLYEFVEHPKPH